tara:strand:+ start:1146 stop:1361 length:216 start_codon:yes stop_codon:yes gene_type:complete
MRDFRIYAGKYQLSKQLGGKEVPAIPSMYHAEILDDRSGKLARTAFLTRKTYDEVLKVAEEYVKIGQKKAL